MAASRLYVVNADEVEDVFRTVSQSCHFWWWIVDIVTWAVSTAAVTNGK